MRNVLIASLILHALLPGRASADGRCDAPVADWKPREVLKAKLEADGWIIRSITAHDGCYEANGTNGAGAVVRAVFDPKSLQRVDPDTGDAG